MVTLLRARLLTKISSFPKYAKKQIFLMVMPTPFTVPQIGQLGVQEILNLHFVRIRRRIAGTNLTKFHIFHYQVSGLGT